MKKIFVLLIFCSFSLVIFSQENKNIETSKQIIDSFQKNEYAQIVETFDSTMKEKLPTEKLKNVWDELSIKCGKLVNYTNITETKIENYHVVYILCHFEKINLKMKTVFNDENKVAGLFFIPDDE